MNHILGFYRAMALFVLAGIAASPLLAQAPANRAVAPAVVVKPAAPAGGAAASGSGAGWIATSGPFRKLAPGVMQDVDLAHQPEETVERHPVTELLFIDPNFDFAKDVPFRHLIWALEIKYKPVRMIWADIPGPDGRMQRRQIWYIVYQVTNPGQAYQPVEKDDELNKLKTSGRLYELKIINEPRRFSPVFTLETHNLLVKEVPGFAKAAVEQDIPIVIPAIRAREDKNREFLTSAQMAQKDIAVGETVWGVATWQDVDPNNVWFSVYVEGLTNAYKWNDDPAKFAAYKNGTSTTPFREISTKVLKLNFWRPGDEFNVRETQVRTGVPELSGGPAARPAFEWVWWRTFPPSEKAVPPGQ